MLLYYADSYFVLSFLACYSAYSVFTIRYSEYRRKGIRMTREAERKTDFITSETFANYYNVKYFRKEQEEISRYK